jgi:RNA-directed DNA polymerase
LANLFLHCALDAWMAREFPDVPFERYADDAVAHWLTEAQARSVLDAIAARLAQVGLELHPDKTGVVHCKDADRTGSFEDERFNFFGYTFRPRLSRSRHGHFFVNLSPAVSDDAKMAIGREIRFWRINCRSDKTLTDLARMFNPMVQGWINYYGRSTSRCCIPSSGASTNSSFVGPCGSTSGCAAI